MDLKSELLEFLNWEIKDATEHYWLDKMQKLKSVVKKLDNEENKEYTIKRDDYGLSKWQDVTRDLGVDFHCKEIVFKYNRVEVIK